MRNHARRLAASRMYLLEDDVDAIQSLVAALPDGPILVVDLGAGSGTTALAVLDVRDDASIITVDNDRSALDWAGAAVRNTYPDADWRPMHADAAVAATFVPDPIALLLHDAGHGRDDVARDLEAWLPLLAPGTPVWVHDYAPAPASWGQPHYPGVAEAIADLVARGMLIESGTHGLGWSGERA